MTHVTCRLNAKNRDQLRNPTLGNRVRATFTFLSHLRQTEDGTEQPRYADQHSRPVSRRRLLAQRVEYWSVVSGTRVPKHPGIYVRIPEYTAGRVLRNSGRRR